MRERIVTYGCIAVLVGVAALAAVATMPNSLGPAGF